MKVIFLFVLFSFLAMDLLFSQDTITIFYDKNWDEISNKDSAVYYRKAFLDSNRVWTAHDYYISNKIQMTGTYKSKKLKSKHGHFIYYYENGQKKSEGIYINNNNEGIWTYWDEGGEIHSSGKFLKNEKEGLWKYWYANGQLKGEEIFKKGLINSATGYYENGNISVKGNYMNEKKQGEWTYWNIDGRIILKGNFNNGTKDGAWVRYFRSGDMKIIYNKGTIEGKHLGGIIRNKGLL